MLYFLRHYLLHSWRPVRRRGRSQELQRPPPSEAARQIAGKNPEEQSPVIKLPAREKLLNAAGYGIKRTTGVTFFATIRKRYYLKSRDYWL